MHIPAPETLADTRRGNIQADAAEIASVLKHAQALCRRRGGAFDELYAYLDDAPSVFRMADNAAELA